MLIEKNFIKIKENILFFNNKLLNFDSYFNTNFFSKPENLSNVFDFELKNKISKINSKWLFLNNYELNKELGFLKLYKMYNLNKNNTASFNFNFFNSGEIFLFKIIGTDKLQDIKEAVPRIQSLFELTFSNEELNLVKNFICISTKSLKNAVFSIYSKFILKKQIKNKCFEFIYISNLFNGVDPEQLMWKFFESNIKKYPLSFTLFYSVIKTQKIIVKNLKQVYLSQNINLNDLNFEVLIRLLINKVKIIFSSNTPFFEQENLSLNFFDCLLKVFDKYSLCYPFVLPKIEGALQTTKNQESFLASISFQNTSTILTQSAIFSKKDWISNIKSELILNKNQNMGTNFGINVNKI